MKFLPRASRLSATLFWFLVTGLPAFAQSTRSEIEIVQEAFGVEKKAAVAQFMDLGEDPGIFWALYDAYEAERKQLANRRIEVIEAYANNYTTLTEDRMLTLLKQTTEIKKSYDKLQLKYFKRMHKVLGANIAAQFWQLENYFNVLIQAAIYSQIPFIDEGMGNN